MGFGFVMTKILFAQNSWNKVKSSSKIQKLEKFIFTFTSFFDCCCQSSKSGMENGHLTVSRTKFEFALISPNFLRSFLSLKSLGKL